MTTNREPGAVVAWRNKIGDDRWFYSEMDPREVHDNGKQTDALVLATDYAASPAPLRGRRNCEQRIES